MTEEQRIAELMKPRFLVLEGWPGSENFPFHKGDIIIQNKPGKAWESIHGRNVYFGVNPDMHPHLFKRLEWWEYRKPEEMPRYLKYRDRVIDVNDAAVACYPKEGQLVIDYENTESHIKLSDCRLISLSKYQQYINSKQKP